MSERNDARRTAGKMIARRAAYAIAAAATSAASAGQAGAEIVYFAGDGFDIPQGIGTSLDFNGDEYNDIKLKNYIFTPGGNYQGLTVGFSPGKVVGFKSGSLYYTTALTAGDPINSSTLGAKFFGSMAYGTINPNAQFKNVDNKYIGFAFPIGQTDLYYAWIRVKVDNAAGLFHVYDYAYENQTGVGILAGDTGAAAPVKPGDFNGDGAVNGSDILVWQQKLGTDLNAADLQDWKDNFGFGAATPAVGVVPEPGTLGMLAAGSAGVALLRRRQQR